MHLFVQTLILLLVWKLSVAVVHTTEIQNSREKTFANQEYKDISADALVHVDIKEAPAKAEQNKLWTDEGDEYDQFSESDDSSWPHEDDCEGDDDHSDKNKHYDHKSKHASDGRDIMTESTILSTTLTSMYTGSSIVFSILSTGIGLPQTDYLSSYSSSTHSVAIAIDGASSLSSSSFSSISATSSISSIPSSTSSSSVSSFSSTSSISNESSSSSIPSSTSSSPASSFSSTSSISNEFSSSSIPSSTSSSPASSPSSTSSSWNEFSSSSIQSSTYSSPSSPASSFSSSSTSASSNESSLSPSSFSTVSTQFSSSLTSQQSSTTSQSIATTTSNIESSKPTFACTNNITGFQACVKEGEQPEWYWCVLENWVYQSCEPDTVCRQGSDGGVYCDFFSQ